MKFEFFTAVKIQVLLGYDSVQCSGRIPTFQRSMLLSSSPYHNTTHHHNPEELDLKIFLMLH